MHAEVGGQQTAVRRMAVEQGAASLLGHLHLRRGQVQLVDDLAESEPSLIDLDEEKVRGWLEKGAQPTESVAKLLKAKGIG